MKMYMILSTLVLPFALSACSSTGGGQSAAMQQTAPAGERSVAVLTDEPMSLQLTTGGQTLDVTPSWTETGRGYEGTVKFPVALTRHSSARLTRADGNGWSDWGASEMRYLRNNDVTVADPACVGGTAWCATRGL